MHFNVSRDNILRMFRNEHRDRLNAAGKGQLDSMADLLDIAEEALAAVLLIVNTETATAVGAFQEGILDSRRQSRGMTGPGVVSSHEVRRTLADDIADKVKHDDQVVRDVTGELLSDDPTS